MISVIEFISKTVTYYPSQKAFAKVSAVNINKIIVFSTKKKKKKKKLATDALKTVSKRAIQKQQKKLVTWVEIKLQRKIKNLLLEELVRIQANRKCLHKQMKHQHNLKEYRRRNTYYLKSINLVIKFDYYIYK